MTINVEIFSQGNEVITGQTVDSNAAWLSRQLVTMGFNVSRHTTVGDKMDDLVALLQEIAERADCCICTGGLGPTVDDLTAEAVARAFGLPLEFDEIAYHQIEQFFKRRDRHMPESNRKQAMLPQGAIRLDNQWGTAPGFALHYKKCWLAFVPGVPSEMRNLFKEKILPILDKLYSVQPSRLVTIKTIGLGESDLQERLENVNFPKGVQLGFRTGTNEIQTKLQFTPGFPESEIEVFATGVANQIGDYVFAIDGLSGQENDLVGVISEILNQREQTLAVVETISHGLLSAKCMGHQFLDEAIYGPTIAKLVYRLGLDYREEEETESGARLARAIKSQAKSDFALVQLYKRMQFDDHYHEALRDKDKTITLYNVLATENAVYHQTSQVSGPSKRKQNQAALSALDFLRRYLQDKI